MTDILLVHSNEKLLDIYCQRLRRHFRTHRAQDGISGVRMIRRINPMVVVAEYELPWLSGIGILRFVRSHPTLSRIPVLMVSREGPITDALAAGVNEWIKIPPASISDLMQKIVYHALTAKAQIYNY